MSQQETVAALAAEMRIAAAKTEANQLAVTLLALLVHHTKDMETSNPMIVPAAFAIMAGTALGDTCPDAEMLHVGVLGLTEMLVEAACKAVGLKGGPL